jgi:hypothetical protein
MDMSVDAEYAKTRQGADCNNLVMNVNVKQKKNYFILLDHNEINYISPFQQI